MSPTLLIFVIGFPTFLIAALFYFICCTPDDEGDDEPIRDEDEADNDEEEVEVEEWVRNDGGGDASEDEQLRQLEHDAGDVALV